MENHFKHILQSLAPVKEQELLAVSVLAQPKSYTKGERFASPNAICQHVGFLRSGIFRVYHINEGKEVTDYFNTQGRNPFVSSFRSFLSKEPQEVYVEAITDAELSVISYEDLQNLYNQFKSLERIGRLMAEKKYLLALERIESLQYHSAGQRYKAFLKQYPLLINQIPHHFIASYLGVTPESLSRIRKSFLKEL